MCAYRFMVTDLPGAFNFRISLTFSICFEFGSACEQEQVLLNNALLPRQPCDFNIGTPITSKKFYMFLIILDNHLIKRLKLLETSCFQGIMPYREMIKSWVFGTKDYIA